MPASFRRTCFGPAILGEPPSTHSWSKGGERRASWSKDPDAGEAGAPPRPGALHNGHTRVIVVGHQRTCIPIWNYKRWLTAPLSEFSSMLSGFYMARIGMFSLAWRTGRVLALAFYVRRQYKSAEAKAKALEAAGREDEQRVDMGRLRRDGPCSHGLLMGHWLCIVPPSAL